jgi:hypothetical protein
MLFLIAARDRVNTLVAGLIVFVRNSMGKVIIIETMKLSLKKISYCKAEKRIKWIIFFSCCKDFVVNSYLQVV